MQAEHGRGGIGVVMRARDRRLGRDVALKQLLQDNAAARLRFEREMRITAKLQHPGVVPIHEAGVFDDGRSFCAMKLVEGRPLLRPDDIQPVAKLEPRPTHAAAHSVASAARRRLKVIP